MTTLCVSPRHAKGQTGHSVCAFCTEPARPALHEQGCSAKRALQRHGLDIIYQTEEQNETSCSEEASKVAGKEDRVRRSPSLRCGRRGQQHLALKQRNGGIGPCSLQVFCRLKMQQHQWMARNSCSHSPAVRMDHGMVILTNTHGSSDRAQN